MHIGDHVFIGANATILPGVTVGDNAVIGAGSVVTRDVPPNTVAAGVPARVLCSVDDYAEKNRARMHAANTFGEEYRMGSGLDETKKNELIQATSEQTAFIR